MTLSAVIPPIPPHHATAVAAGAECWRCPLLNCGRGPVPSALPPGYTFVVVAEAPGTTEVAEGKTLVGPSGREVRKALQTAGQDPNITACVNAIQCMPDGGDLKRYLRTVKKSGQASPIDCCRPRLEHELRPAKFALLMGGAAMSAVGQGSSVMKLRGTPLTVLSGLPALATPHAAFVLRDEGRVMRPIFHADVAKAVRFSRGGNTWRDPAYYVARSAAEIENFLNAQGARIAVDVETDGKDPWVANLRRVGMGTDTQVMIYSPLSVHGHYRLPVHEIQAQSRAIASHFRRAPRIDGHNILAYDSIVLARHGMPLDDSRVADSLIGHQIGPTSELPHALDFLGSLYTDAPRWKDDVKHSEVKSDEVLDRYLSFDIAVTYQSMPYVERNVLMANQAQIYAEDFDLFRIGRSMSALGVGVDPVKRRAFAEEYQKKADTLYAEFMGVAGREVNPNSPVQVRKLLYTDLGLPELEEHMTGSDEASTDEGTLLDLLSLGLDERAEKIIHAILGCREAEKILGTFTGRFVNGAFVGGPPIHTDGRLRVSWRPGKRSGRWGSSPNLQNIPLRLREMFTPAPGNLFVAADMSAVELRMIAWLANDEPLIKAFAEFDAGTGPDVHIANACAVFKCAADKVDKTVRTFIKRFVYALSYDAEPPKIFQTLSLLRDDNLRPLFPNISLAEVERLFNLWWQLHPAIPAWKKKLIHGWRSRGYIETRLGQRKRFFVGGERAPEMGNHDVQGSSAKLQNDSIRAISQVYPFDYERHRGVVLNGHDQIVVECAAHESEDVKRLLSQHMQKRLEPMLFPAEPTAAKDWKAVS